MEEAGKNTAKQANVTISIVLPRSHLQTEDISPWSRDKDRVTQKDSLYSPSKLGFCLSAVRV